MSQPPSDIPLDIPLAATAASQQLLRHRRLLATQSIVAAVIAVVAGVAWGPIMGVIARLLRPPQLSNSRLSYLEAAPFQHEAELRMWIILIASFLLVLALVTLAITRGRRALRLAESRATAGRLGTWGGACLAICLLSLGSYILLQYMSVSGGPPTVVPYIVSQLATVVLVATFALSAMGSFVLNGIAVRRALAWLWISEVVSALMVFLWFLAVAFIAQFVVAFYLHLVY